MTEMLLPGAPEFREIFRTFRRSVFRLEALQHYEPDEAFEAFAAGRPEPPDPHHDAWCERIAANVRAGKVVQRVHVVTEPLTTNMTYELTWGYAPNVRAGEDVRIIPVHPGREWPSDVPRHDFWLFDDADLYRLHYSLQGVLLGIEHITAGASIEAARDAKATTLLRGLTWNDYLSARPDLARHLQMARAS